MNHVASTVYVVPQSTILWYTHIFTHPHTRAHALSLVSPLYSTRHTHTNHTISFVSVCAHHIHTQFTAIDRVSNMATKHSTSTEHARNGRRMPAVPTRSDASSRSTQLHTHTQIHMHIYAHKSNSRIPSPCSQCHVILTKRHVVSSKTNRLKLSSEAMLDCPARNSYPHRIPALCYVSPCLNAQRN